MPTERYRDPNTGRWVSRDVAGTLGDVLRELFEGKQRTEQELIQEGEVTTPFGTVDITPNWKVEQTDRGEVWQANGLPLNPDALAREGFPSGMSRFQVRFMMPSSISYPRGWASYDTLFYTEWPPDVSWGNASGATGIGAIVFSR